MIGTINCTYETPCGWCTKWDKKCDKKIEREHDGPVGKKGAIGICPNCGHSGYISWDPYTDISSCSCGWNNGKPQRGLRVKINPMDDAIDFSYGKCFDCKYDVGCNKECDPENNFKYFQPKEKEYDQP